MYRCGLARGLLEVGRVREAIDQAGQGLAMSPNPGHRQILQLILRDCYLRQKKWEDARVAWRAALDAMPPTHNNCYGYAELCSFLGNEEEYLGARRELLAGFGASTDPAIAVRTSRACLLRPASPDEMKVVDTLIDSTLAADRSKYQALYPYFLFSRGLAEFRQGRFVQAIGTMRGEADRAAGPAPKLVLAMALFRSGEVAEARKELADAVAGHNWNPSNIRDQEGWIYHSLRREAEALITADDLMKD
jgi:serine/threonine-protein kinase